LFFSFYIFPPFPYYSDRDRYTLILEIIAIHLVFVSDIRLEIATILLGYDRQYDTEFILQLFHEFTITERVLIMTIWDTYQFLPDTLNLQFFTTDSFREESMSRNSKMSSSVISIAIFAKESYCEHADRDDLSLDIVDSDSFTDLVTAKYDKKGNNREDKITKCNDQSTSNNDKKIGANACPSDE
jgi:hypothetical protein